MKKKESTGSAMMKKKNILYTKFSFVQVIWIRG